MGALDPDLLLTADVIICNADNVSVEKPSCTQILQINKSTAAVE